MKSLCCSIMRAICLGRKVVLFIIIHLLGNGCYGNVSPRRQETLLRRQLLQDYDPDARPRNPSDHTLPLQVHTTFTLLGIKEFDEKYGKFSLAYSVLMMWEDEMLSWNSSDHGNLTSIKIRRNTVWYPTLCVHGNFRSMTEIGSTRRDEIVNLYSTGLIVWPTPEVSDVQCSANITHFPFDEQTCFIDFIPIYYYNFEIRINIQTDIFTKMYYAENGIWTVVSVRSFNYGHADNNITQVSRFEIVIRRKYLYYLISIILPIIILDFVNIFVFCLPPSEGERSGFAVTLFLAYTVYLSVIADRLPESSYPSVSILSILLFGDFVQSCLIVLCTVLTLHVHSRHGNGTGNRIGQFICTCRRRLSLCLSKIRICRRRKLEPNVAESISSSEEMKTKVENDLVHHVGYTLDKAFFSFFAFLFVVKCYFYVSI